MGAPVREGIGVWFGGDNKFDRREIKGVVQEFLSSSTLFTSLTKPIFLEKVIEASLRTGEPVVVVSSVCPPYSTSQNGAPNYEALNSGIEHNIRQHLVEVPKGIRLLRSKGISVIHFFLMADTEVDLLPFLQKLNLSTEEFTRRCQDSVESIGEEMKNIYPDVCFEKYGIPLAARFLEYFREDSWYQTYEFFRQKLIFEADNNDLGRVASSLQRDTQFRSRIIERLLGPVGQKEKIDHIARQKAQYMAFSKLMRERFEGRLIIVNHATPNFEWMNDQMVRQYPDSRQVEEGNFLPKIPLIELNISTMPEEK